MTATHESADPDAGHVTGQGAEHVADKLSTLDRFLPVWIGVAMVAGIVLGRAIPDLNDTIEKVKLDTVSLPIAIGLFAMMYPVLAKVKYRAMGSTIGDKRSLGMSLVLNWVIGPAAHVRPGVADAA